MLNYNLVETIHALHMLGHFEKRPRRPPAPPAQVDAYKGLLGNISLADLGNTVQASNELTDHDRDSAKKLLDDVAKLVSSLELDATPHRMMLFRVKLEHSMTPEDFVTEIRVLRETFEGDLYKCHFYHYPPEKLKVLMKFYPTWKRVREAFPLTKDEALAATDCYGMGLDTASVFHSMRVAEHGLRALVKERKINLPKNKPIEWGTWQDLIDRLSAEVIKIGKTAKAGGAKDNALAFYSGALADLNGFKDEYRNQVMHVRKAYDQHQALRALDKVHSFMDRVSEKMDHKHHSIRWGLKFSKHP